MVVLDPALSDIGFSAIGAIDEAEAIG